MKKCIWSYRICCIGCGRTTAQFVWLQFAENKQN